jgi:hypothetical protein
MKLTFHRGDVKVDVDADGSEASALLQQFLSPSTNGNGHPAPALKSTLPPSEGSQDQAETDKAIELLEEIGDAPFVVLLTLFEHPDGLNDLELKAALAPKGIVALAGSMTAIAKACTRLKIERESVLERTSFHDRKRRGKFFRYKIGKTARAVLKATDIKSIESRRIAAGKAVLGE